MKTIATLLALLWLTACAPLQPLPSTDTHTGHFLITEYDQNGNVRDKWEVEAYKETQFPRSVSFTTSQGQGVFLNGSYQINEVAP